MSKLKKLEPKIKAILESNPTARKDDFILVLEVYKRIIDPNTPISDALGNHKKHGLPPFASIVRVRRKLQSTDPSLCDAATVVKRADAEDDFREYVQEA